MDTERDHSLFEKDECSENCCAQKDNGELFQGRDSTNGCTDGCCAPKVGDDLLQVLDTTDGCTDGCCAPKAGEDLLQILDTTDGCTDACCAPRAGGELLQVLDTSEVHSDNQKVPKNPLDAVRSVFRIDGMDCGECAKSAERVVRKLAGVQEVSVNFSTTKMQVTHTTDIASIAKTVEQVGYRATLLETTGQESGSQPENRVSEFNVYGMDCSECAATIEKRLNQLGNVEEASVNFSTAKLKVVHSGPIEDILKTVTQAGYRADLIGQTAPSVSQSYWDRHKRTILTVASGILLGIGALLESLGVSKGIVITLFLLSMISGGFYAARAGYYAIKSLTLDMNFLMTAAAIGAAAIGQWSEAATVVFLFSVGNWLQSMTMERTRRSIRSLMDLAPKEALVRRGNDELKLPIEELNIGDVVIVKPGERLPMDGIVIAGSSTINQAPITGESMPVTKVAGNEVYAGTINETGSIEYKVTKKVEDTTLSRIIHLVEEAQSQKAPSQQFVDAFAKYYTPIVVLLALVIAVVPPLFTSEWSVWIYRALVLLVIACPCALVISTPVAIVSAIGNAAKKGVLIKGGAYLETMGSIHAIAFDKTGTLTQGKPEVVSYETFGDMAEEKFLSIAAAIESRSEHPLARAILDKYQSTYTKEVPQIREFRAISGFGASGFVEGAMYRIGKPSWFTTKDNDFDSRAENISALQEQGCTVMLVGDEQNVIGLIAVSDVVRQESAATIQSLKEAGIARTFLLTGDNERSAKAIQQQIKLDEAYAELLPESKLEKIRALQDQFTKVAMVGDGMNDAPALATADIGIAMGGSGTDTALETADIVLMADDLSKLPFTVRLSRQALGVIKQNIWFALLVKIVFLALSVTGHANLWMAVFADTGAALIVIANGLRLQNDWSRVKS